MSAPATNEPASSGPEGAVKVSVCLQKGGVGKSTTTLNLARAGAVQGLRVLVADMDPQGNATAALATSPVGPREVGIADALAPEPDYTLGEVVIDTIWPGVSLAPAVTRPLTKVEKLISVEPTGREHFARDAFEPVCGDYDLILFDTPPALGLLTTNALTASDRVLVVAEGEQWSTDGLAELRRTVEDVRRYSNPALTWAGVLINKWRNTKAERELVDEIEQHFPQAPVWPERVRLWESIRTHRDAGLGLDESRESRLRVLADDYGAMITRLMNPVGQVPA